MVGNKNRRPTRNSSTHTNGCVLTARQMAKAELLGARKELRGFQAESAIVEKQRSQADAVAIQRAEQRSYTESKWRS